MNNKILKTVKVSIPAALMLILSGCLKTHDGFIDFTKTSDFVILTGAGTGNLKASNIQFIAGDTVTKTITVDLASSTDNNGKITVTLGIDNDAITAYNAANGTNYQPFPTDAFTLASNTVDIAAGDHYGTTSVQMIGHLLDPTISYMLPIAITDGGGKSLSSNQNIIYYNVIGNPIAGSYTWDFYRWNATDSLGALSSLSFMGATVSFVADDPTTIEVPTGYFDQQNYVIHFDNNAGVLSNFTVKPSDAMLSSFASNGITITDGPTLTYVDPVAKHFIVRMITASRFLVDDYHQ